MHNNHFDPTKPVVVHPGIAGPCSEIGKQTSSRNAMRHGCCSTETLILKTENLEDYKALEATWFKAYSPKTTPKSISSRNSLTPTGFCNARTTTSPKSNPNFGSSGNPPILGRRPSPRSHPLHALSDRACQHGRQVPKSLEDYRKNRATEAVRAEQLVIKKERHEVFKDKANPSQPSRNFSIK